jgi:hypothetical protein
MGLIDEKTEGENSRESVFLSLLPVRFKKIN